MLLSPRTWGWSGPGLCTGSGGAVVPTHVGMVRAKRRRAVGRRCCPHARGDGPQNLIVPFSFKKLSPRTWGWSEINLWTRKTIEVVPTHVGMVRRQHVSLSNNARCPHARGDGPSVIADFTRQKELSPRTWGWSSAPAWSCPIRRVVPTHVGMVRRSAASEALPPRCPHARGDGPRLRRWTSCSILLSPRTWGWSGLNQRMDMGKGVVPTHVGMVRTIRISNSTCISCPHARGDGPFWKTEEALQYVLSPRTWGWSARARCMVKFNSVVPTHVGMVRIAACSLPVFFCCPHARGDGPFQTMAEFATF